jgi:glutamate-ammonia-ligase adenylyltransferase
MLVVLRLVAAEGMEPAEQSRALVATLCGYDEWSALTAAIGSARERISARWAAVAKE